MPSQPAVRILALETTSDRGSVALLEGSRLLVQQELPAGQRSARSLVPTFDAIVRTMNWSPADLQLVAVATGPGSFTGLRVGITTAKTLAYALRIPVAGINTLDVLAAQTTCHCARLACILDAQRRQLYLAHYATDRDHPPRRLSDIEIVDMDAWLKQLDASTMVTGPPLFKLRDRLPSYVQVAAPEAWTPRAAVVGQLGFHAWTEGNVYDAFTLNPEYYRKSAAEEKREQSV